MDRFGRDGDDQIVVGWWAKTGDQQGGAGVQLDSPANRRLVELLTRIVQRSRDMQNDGRLQGRSSRAEVELIEHHLRLAKARLAMAKARRASTLEERARATVTLAEEAREAARAARRASQAASQRNRRTRKRLYQNAVDNRT